MNYAEIPNDEIIKNATEEIQKRGIIVQIVQNKTEALETIKKMIPSGATVMNGSSQTLEQIGFVDYLKSGSHDWKNLHAEILAEKDPIKQSALRKQSVLSDYYLGSVHAIAKTGELVIASNSGSQLPHLTFTSPNIILVAGTQKITPNLESALARLHDYVLPLEDERMKSVGMGGSAISKLLIFEREPSFMERKVYLILVNEKLGF